MRKLKLIYYGGFPMKKYILISVILIFACYSLVYGQQGNRMEFGDLNKGGTTAAAFLSIPVGAHAMGLGGAFTANASDVSALYWNPAGITQIQGIAFGVSRTNLYADIKHSFLGFVFDVPGFAHFGISSVILTSGDIEITTLSQPDGTGFHYDVSNISLAATVAKSVTDWFQVGVTVKYIQEKIYTEEANGVAFDIGSLFNTGIWGLKIGMALSNFGTDMAFGGPSTTYVLRSDPNSPDLGYTPEVNAKTGKNPLPLQFRGGILFDLIGGVSPRFPNDQNRITMLIDFDDAINTDMRSSFGVEYEWNKVISLRSGYKLNYDAASYSVGFGLKWNTDRLASKFDYAYANFSDLGNVHQFFISFGL